MSVFDNLPAGSAIPDYTNGISDPNNTAQEPLPVAGESPMVGPGGKTVIRPTDLSGESGTKQTMPFNNANPADLMAGGIVQGTTLPVAKPIDPITFGDPNNSAIDFKDGSDPGSYNLTGADITRHGFDTTDSDNKQKNN